MEGMDHVQRACCKKGGSAPFDACPVHHSNRVTSSAEPSDTTTGVTNYRVQREVPSPDKSSAEVRLRYLFEFTINIPPT